MKDEALKLALGALECKDGWGSSIRSQKEKAITAIKQALAAQHEPENEPFVSLASVQEPVPVFELQKSGWEIICDLDWIQTLPFGTKLYTTPPAQPAVQEGQDWSLLEATQESLREHMAEINRLKAAQPTVPDALNPKDENPAYAAGWNDCRQAMLEMMK
jgi:hypothetical protein